MRRILALATLSVLALAACQKNDQAQTTDTTARDLTLAPAESTAAMRDMPDQRTSPPAAPRTNTPARRTNPPAAPSLARLSSGARFSATATDTITSRTAKVNDPFTARVSEDVKNAAGEVVIPAGSIVNGTITDVKPAPNPRTAGTLTLSVTSVTVRGNTYPITASIDSVETTRQGRGVTTGDAAKVGAGAVAGAVLGRVIGGNRKGTIIGGVVGGIAGAGVATQTKDADIVLPAGAHIVVRLTQELAVQKS